MIKNLHRIEWFVGLALLQVLVFNQLHIGGYATPFLYIYFIIDFLFIRHILNFHNTLC